MDRLEAIMNKQKELQSRVDDRCFSDESSIRADYMRDQRGYLADEVGEALYEMPYYKLWKNYNDMSPEAEGIQWQKVRMELIDALHFFVNLLICADMSAEEVYQMYMAKNKENFRRQDAGYTADVSYRDQAVEDVMKPRCTVTLNGKTDTAENFIAMMISDEGLCSFAYSADVAVLGFASRILNDAYAAELKQLSEDERAEVIQAAVKLHDEYRGGHHG